MYHKKVYGQSKIETCPFCDKQAQTKNQQGIPVCLNHKQATFPDMKCICGDWLDLKQGKYGPFFSCMKCGAMNFNKAMEINGKPTIGKVPEQKKQQTSQNKPKPLMKKERKETVVTSDMIDAYFT